FLQVVPQAQARGGAAVAANGEDRRVTGAERYAARGGHADPVRAGVEAERVRIVRTAAEKDVRQPQIDVLVDRRATRVARPDRAAERERWCGKRHQHRHKKQSSAVQPRMVSAHDVLLSFVGPWDELLKLSLCKGS